MQLVSAYLPVYGVLKIPINVNKLRNIIPVLWGIGWLNFQVRNFFLFLLVLPSNRWQSWGGKFRKIKILATKKIFHRCRVLKINKNNKKILFFSTFKYKFFFIWINSKIHQLNINDVFLIITNRIYSGYIFLGS